jgi:hypothetical protein
MTINWDAFGALAEALGAVAVIMSVLYLAVQIRSQTQEARLAATRELSAELRRMLETIALDKEFSEIYQAAIYDYEGLDSNDRMRISYSWQAMFRLIEQQHLHTVHGSIDPVYLESVERVFREFVKNRGVVSFWQLSRHSYAEDFCTYIDQLIAQAEATEFQSSFNRTPNGDAQASRQT